MNKAHSKKRTVTPAGTLYPNPASLITSRGKDRKTNIFTAAWVSQVAMNPPHVAVAIRPTRFSFSLIEDSEEFGVNLPTAELAREVDICGNTSGRHTDKWEITGLTPEEPAKTSVPLIKECPVNLECRVIHKLEVGTHFLLIGEVVARHEAEDFSPGQLLAYVSPEYRNVGEKTLGYYGYSKKE